MSSKYDAEPSRLDEAARAGWLYYVAGNTQDEIAKKLGVSRQSAQRLVSLAISAKLIKVRLDHPIAQCMELSLRLKDKFGLQSCEVVPSDPTSSSVTLGIAQAGAAEMERHLKSEQPIIMSVGTGRTLRACVDQLQQMDCQKHRIISLVGNIASDGSASAYDVIVRLADTIKSPHFPLPLPVIAASVEEREILQSQKFIRHILDLAKQSDVTFVGIGHLEDNAPLLEDHFITSEERSDLIKAGAVGEIVGWAYDAQGSILEGHTNDRVASVPIFPNHDKPVIGIASGIGKISAISGALQGKLVNSLITNEATAEQLLNN